MGTRIACTRIESFDEGGVQSGGIKNRQWSAMKSGSRSGPVSRVM